MQGKPGDFWGVELKAGEAGHKIDLPDDTLVLITGVCCDLNADKNFRAALVVKLQEQESGETKEHVVAHLSYGVSENINFEVPVYNGATLINKTNSKTSIHCFGRYVDFTEDDDDEDLGDVMDPQYAHAINEMMTANGMEEESDEDSDGAEITEVNDEAENSKKDKSKPKKATVKKENKKTKDKKVAKEPEIEEDEEESEEEEMEEVLELENEEDESDGDYEEGEEGSDSEEDLENLIEGRFGKDRLAKTGKKVIKEIKIEDSKKLIDQENGKKRRISIEEDKPAPSNNKEKKQKMTPEKTPTKEEIIQDIKGWIEQDGGKTVLQSLGSKIYDKYKLGFKQLKLGETKLTNFIHKESTFKLEGEHVKLNK